MILLLSLCLSNCCICILFRNLYLYRSFSIVCCLGVIEGSGCVVMVSESVIGVMLIYFAYPSYSDYFIGKGDARTIITDIGLRRVVTFIGDTFD